MRIVVGDEHRVEHRDVDVLSRARALALMERREHADQAVQGRVRVGDREDRIGVRRRVEPGLPLEDPGLRVDHRGVGRASRFGRRGAESRDREHHEARVECVETLPAEAVAIEHAGAEVLDQHVGALCEPQQERRAAGLLEVDAERALARVLLCVVPAEPVPDLAPPARDVALGRLHLDDVRAEVGQHAGRERTREHAREVEHAQRREREVHRD